MRHRPGWIGARLRLRHERGASSVEYAILAAAIAVAIILGALFLGIRTSGNFECTGESIASQTTAC